MASTVPEMYVIARKALPLIKKYYEEHPEEKNKFNFTATGNHHRTDSRDRPHQFSIPASRTVRI